MPRALQRKRCLAQLSKVMDASSSHHSEQTIRLEVRLKPDATGRRTLKGCPTDDFATRSTLRMHSPPARPAPPRPTRLKDLAMRSVRRNRDSAELSRIQPVHQTL